MRTSQARRYARWSAIVAILLAAGVTSVYLQRFWRAKLAEQKAPPSVPAAVQQSSAEFSYSKVQGQHTIYTVRASRSTQFKEGSRNLLEDVSITVFGQKGERNDKLITRACDFISDTGKITCAGDVQITLQASGAAAANAVHITTSGVSFDQGSAEAQTDKPVTFNWPDGQGRATGMRYDSGPGALILQHDVDLKMAVSSPGLPQKTKAAPEQLLNVTGNTLTFRRENHDVLVQGNVHAQQTTHELSAKNLLVNLDSSFHAQNLAATGQPHLTDAGPQGPTSLSADKISANLRPNSSVQSVIASGNVHGNRTSPEGADTLEAAQMQLDFEQRQNQNAPSLLTARGGVTLNSQQKSATAGTRRLESEALEMHFVQSPEPGPAKIESVNTLAPARVEWQNTSIKDGKVTPQLTRMRGNQMKLQFAGENKLQKLVSSGGIEVTRKVDTAPEQTTTSRELTANFANDGQWSTIDQSGDVHFHDDLRSAQGDRAHMERANNTAMLNGSVILTDATMRTTAQSALFTQGTSELHADGKVLSTELHAGSGDASNFGPEPARISAEHLVADTARGHAVYSGNGRLWQGQSLIEASTIELDNHSHTLVARGQVHGVFPQASWNPAGSPATIQTKDRPATDRPATVTPRQAQHADLGQVRGELLTYWDNESRARVEQGARLDSSRGSIQGDLIDLYFSPASPSENASGNAPGNVSANASGASKQLSRAVATGNVAVRQQDRRGTSNRADYTAADGKFVLSEGKPTVYDLNGDTTTGRQLTFFFADDRIIVDSAEGSRTLTLHRVEK